MKKSVIYLRVNFAQTVKVFLNGEEKKEESVLHVLFVTGVW